MNIDDRIQAIAVVVAALGILYVAAGKRLNAPRLKFDFESGDANMQIDKLSGIDFRQRGIIRNLSAKQDSISRIALIIWRKEFEFKEIDGIAFKQIVVENYNSPGESYVPPFNIPGRVAVAIEITIKGAVFNGTVSKKLRDGVLNPSFSPRVSFETTDGSWFDGITGKFIDVKTGNLRYAYRKTGFAWYKPRSYLKKRFWKLQWQLTLSDSKHTGRQIRRFFGL